MPIITIDMMAGRSLEQRRKLVKRVTEAVCESIDTTPERVKIKLNDMSTDGYAISGQLIADQDDPFSKKKQIDLIQDLQWRKTKEKSPKLFQQLLMLSLMAEHNCQIF